MFAKQPEYKDGFCTDVKKATSLPPIVKHRIIYPVHPFFVGQRRGLVDIRIKAREAWTAIVPTKEYIVAKTSGGPERQDLFVPVKYEDDQKKHLSTRKDETRTPWVYRQSDTTVSTTPSIAKDGECTCLPPYLTAASLSHPMKNRILSGVIIRSGLTTKNKERPPSVLTEPKNWKCRPYPPRSWRRSSYNRHNS